MESFPPAIVIYLHKKLESKVIVGEILRMNTKVLERGKLSHETHTMFDVEPFRITNKEKVS